MYNVVIVTLKAVLIKSFFNETLFIDLDFAWLLLFVLFKRNSQKQWLNFLKARLLLFVFHLSFNPVKARGLNLCI